MDQISWRPGGSGLVPHVNGVDLRRLVGDTALTGIDGNLVSPPSDHLLGGPAGGRVAILVCSCGDRECGSVTAMIRQDRGSIVWDDVRGLDGLSLDLGLFTFARKPYDLARAAAR